MTLGVTLGPTSAATSTASRLIDWRTRRDRLIASPRFRRWAAAFPLTRPIARRRTRALFDLCAGFVYSQVLQACVQLCLFDILADGPMTPAALSMRLEMPAERTLRLLLAATSLRLLARRRDGRFALGPLGAAMVGNAAVTAMVLHHRELYADLNDPVALLRGQADPTGLSRYWAYSGNADAAKLEGGQVEAYTALMAASQPMVANEVLAAYRIGRHRRLLDLGGGDGSFLCAAAAQAPDLQLMLFDLPPVAEQARACLVAAGLAGRFEAVGGDFLADPLPHGADVVSLVRVIHDHDDPAALGILRAAHRALPPGGTLLLAEPMAGTSGAEPIGDAYFGFYLMAMGRGRARTQAELFALLRDAGFTGMRRLPTHTPLLVSVIVAKASQDKA
jgi:demethylspheroidene O-methyltransferase